ncbi:PREDICTED: uracil-DNA glycosylase-like [Acropora digitifera]|uniref:uracil-DNA glycosylase-like n=1 Tax=Acropora digitifera TaxID=70779 RepID=UPI00077B17A3|nr:PREDICTED: uracil-DNA glycosylase-like [Acropora digitifera]
MPCETDHSTTMSLPAVLLRKRGKLHSGGPMIQTIFVTALLCYPVGTEAATFKGRANNEGVTLKHFVYTYKCVPGWDQFWNLEEVKGAIEGISVALEKEASQIQPQISEVFKAFMVKPEKIKSVILGQDPTPQAGKATGLAFSLLAGQDPREAPTVLKMLVELKLEGFRVSLANRDLTPWINQGVMLLNAALTLRIGEPGEKAPNSHSKLWEPFTE